MKNILNKTFGLARGFSCELDNVSQTSFANFRLLLRQPGKIGADLVSESEFHLGERESYARSRELGWMIEFLNVLVLSPAREYRPNERVYAVIA